MTQQAIFQQSQRIACYLAFKDEFDSSPIIEAIWQAKKHCYLPVLKDNNGKILDFVKYHYGDALRLNQYGIFEPVNPSPIEPDKLDLVIAPLIAFDLHGNRLGTGGGYYDRTFAFLRENESNKPTLIGLGYAAQQAKALPSDPWDVVLQGVVTEREFIRIPSPTK